MSQDEIDALKNASTIIERFGGIRPMAAKVGAPVTTVQGWKKRDVIPGSRRDDILKAANENNIDLSDLFPGQSRMAPSDRKITSLESPFAGVPQEKADVPVFSSEPLVIEKAEHEKTPASAAPVSAARSGGTHDDLMAVIAQSQRKSARNSFLTMLGFTVFLGGVGAFLLWPSAKKIEQHDGQIAALENQVGMLDADVQGLNDSASSLKAMLPEDIRARMDKLKSEADAISGDLKTVAQQAQDLSKTVLATDAGSLSDRLAALEVKFSEMQGGESLKTLTSRILTLEATVSGQQQMDASINELRKIVDSLDGQVNTLDHKLAEVQKTPGSQLGQTIEGVSPNDLKAAAMLVAFAQLRESVNRNTPFAEDIVLLQKLVGNDDPELQAALEKLAPLAEKGGVLTTEGLQEEFKGLGSDIVFSSLKGEDVSVSEKAKVRLSEIMNVKKDGQVVGGTPTQQAVAKAQEQLNNNDVEGAIATLNGLNGDARTTAQPFIDQAQATLLANQIQNRLRGLILSRVGGGGAYTGSGVPINTKAAAEAAAGAAGAAKDAASGGGVVQDEESGFKILPAPKGFKGFSSVPSE